MKTLKKLFSVSAIVALLGTLAPMYAFGAGNSLDLDPEFPQAYAYAYANGITTQTEDNVDMGGKLTRIALAKMVAKYAINVLKLTPDTSKTCTFTDVTAALDAQYDNGVTQACQLGLMGVNITAFRPNDLVTRGEFGTTFSRALNANSDELAAMNAADPYYKEHLNYLNKEGIMKVIDPNMLEVRGYVMLMMMRSDENYTAVEGCTAEELLACFNADDYDACIAACSNEEPGEEDEPVIVKAGTLNVSATSNDGAKVFLDGVSELDTINLKASEEINVEKVTLEKYGYTVNSGISIWLEDQNGVEITTPKNFPTNKDEITLTIKKDYRNALETKAYVVVVRVNAQTGRNVGDTIGFKVKDITSSAETLKIASYTPATYSMVEYTSSNLQASMKGSDDNYNYEAGKMYQVAKMRITAGTSEVSVNGFTLENVATTGLDLSKYVSKWEVTAGDTTLKLSAADINKNDQTIKFSFPEQTLAAKKSIDFTVKMSVVDNFDQFGKAVKFNLTGVSATETKTSARLTATAAAAAEYTFLGTKVKLTNKKLGKVSAPRGKEDIVVAEGTIELSEAINVSTFNITTATGVESLELWINGELVGEGDNTANANVFVFSNVTLEKSGKLQFVADLVDRDTASGYSHNTITFTPSSFSKSIFAGNFGTYDESNEPVLPASVAGSIAFTNINVETAKGTLENTLTKEVEVLNDKVAHTVTVFEGTYTAKKGDLYLNSGSLTLDGVMSGDDQVIATVTVGDSDFELTFTATGTKSDTFSNVLVKKGEAVNVKIEAEVTAENTGKLDFTLALAGEDLDDMVVDPVSETAVSISRVANGSVTVVASSANDIVLRKNNNLSLVKFTVKPKNDLTDLNRFEITGLTGLAATLSGRVDVYVDGDKLDSDKFAIDNAGKLTINEDIAKALDTDGVDVEVKLKSSTEADSGVLNMTLTTVNGKSVNKTFKKNVVAALVRFTAQEKVGDETVYTISVETANEETEVTELHYVLANGASGYFVQGTVTDGTVRLLNQPNAAQYLTEISYKIDGNVTPLTIDKAQYEDYFRLPDQSFLKAFKAD